MEKTKYFFWTAIIVTTVIVGLWLLNLFLLVNNGDQTRGTFGDMFGAVNALFSGLAFAGIIITILLQRSELKLQRDELRETREEYKTQNETLKLQRFENTFFSLLNLHHQIVGGMNIIERRKTTSSSPVNRLVSSAPGTVEHVTIAGREVFGNRYNQMRRELSDRTLTTFEPAFMRHYSASQTDFGHYFRNLYRMIKLVDQTDFFYDSFRIEQDAVFEIKYKYTSIIRSQLSDYELLWLFYNCASKNGNEKFKPYIEKYSLIKNIPKDLLGNINHVSFYKEEAYGRKDR